MVEVETNGGNGAATLIELRPLGYPEHLIYRMRVMDRASQKQTDILGYQISSKTKPQLIRNWERLLYERVLSLHCAITIGEHCTFVYHPDGSVGAQKGWPDDTVTGSMLAGIAQDRFNPPS